MLPYRTDQMVALRGTVDNDSVDVIENLCGGMGGSYSRMSEIGSYYEGTYRPDGLNISIPKKLMHLINSGLGWGKIIVDTIAERVEILDIRGIDPVIPVERLRNVAVQLHTDILRYGQAFLLVSTDPNSGDPVVSVRTPLNTAALVDQSTGRVTHAVSIEKDFKGREYASVYLGGKTVSLARDRSGEAFKIFKVVDTSFMPLISFSNVGGESEISPSIRSLMNMASTSLVYAKLNEEFFSFPQRYVLGAGEDDFRDSETGQPVSKWKARIDSLFILEKDGTGDNPEVGEFKTNLSDGYLRMVEYLSSQVAAEAGLPATYFGVSTKDALSAEAIEKMENRLIRKALTRRNLWAIPWRYTLETIGAVAGVDVDNPSVVWNSPRNAALGATADAVVKLVGAGVLPPDSDAVLQLLNIDSELQESIRRGREQRRPIDALDKMLNAITDEQAAG